MCVKGGGSLSLAIVLSAELESNFDCKRIWIDRMLSHVNKSNCAEMQHPLDSESIAQSRSRLAGGRPVNDILTRRTESAAGKGGRT